MVSIKVVDFVGKVKDGVGVVLSVNIDDSIYQMVFWFNRDCRYVLNAEEDLLKLLNIDNIYNYEHIDDLLFKIFESLPPVKDLFEKFQI